MIYDEEQIVSIGFGAERTRDTRVTAVANRLEGKNVMLTLVNGHRVHTYLLSAGYKGVTCLSGGRRHVHYYDEIASIDEVKAGE